MREDVGIDGARVPRAETDGPYERCCLCGRLTDVRASDPVHLRKSYVPGAGQLCAACCWEVYRADDLRSLGS